MACVRRSCPSSDVLRHVFRSSSIKKGGGNDLDVVWKDETRPGGRLLLAGRLVDCHLGTHASGEEHMAAWPHGAYRGNIHGTAALHKLGVGVGGGSGDDDGFGFSGAAADGAAVVRRVLQGRGYISYGALRRDTTPCSVRGASYYNCRPGGQANPYSRGCSAITRCRG
uniref:Uncharacterized protein n=1 Tax=Oryza glumipatula TaxID=40148 RepID=A0A0D9YW94_9ORYZ